MTDRPAAPIYRSAAIAVSLTWLMRAIGFASALVLARLLSPKDFGIIAMATAISSLIDMFAVLGIGQTLMRIPNPSRAHIDTAWTLHLIIMTFLGLVLLALAVPASLFFRQPELAPVLALLAFNFPIFGLVNNGVGEFEKNMDFGKDLRMRLCVRLLGTAATIILAFTLRSYWAMAIGLFLSAVIYTAATYVFHPYRPRFCLAKRAELLTVSIWIFITYAMHVVQQQSERVVIGRFAPTAVLGLYSFSKDFSAIFTQEMAIALNRVTFVTTVRRQTEFGHEPDRPIALLGTYAMIMAPIGLGLSAVAADVLVVLFGKQWLAAAPYLRLIAPAGACYAVHNLILSTFQATGRMRGSAMLAGSGALMMVVSLATAGFVGAAPQTLAGIVLAVNAVLLLAGIVVLARIGGTRLLRLLAAVARPFLAAGAMYCLLMRLAPQGSPPALNLLGAVGMGAVIYVAVLFFLWALTGRPAGAEQESVALFRSLAQKGKSQRNIGL